MRRINIIKNNNINTVSFKNESDLFDYIFFNIQTKYDTGLTNADKSKKIANLIWNLNVGKSIKFFEHTFSIQSKARVGNQLVI